MSKKFI